MSYPKELFRDIYWSFSIGKIASANKLTSEIEKYYKAISGKTLQIKWDEIIFDFPELELQYVKYNKGEIEEPFELIKADNGKNFTSKELMFKVHHLGLILKMMIIVILKD